MIVPNSLKATIKFNWVSLLPTFLSCSSCLLFLGYLGYFDLYLPMSLGIIAGSAVDIDNKFSGKLWNSLIVFVVFAVTEILMLLTWQHSILMWIVSIGIAFIYVMLGAFSKILKTIGFGGILIISYSLFLLLHSHSELQGIEELVWMLVAATYYTILSLTIHILFPNRAIKNHVADLYNKLGDFLAVKSNFFDPDDDSFESRLPDINDDQAEYNVAVLMSHRLYNPEYEKTRAALITQFANTKESLMIRIKAFSNRKTTKNMLRFYLASDNIFKALDFNLQDYSQLKHRLSDSDIMFRLQRILVLFSKSSYQFALDLKTNRAPKLDKRIIISIEHLEKSLVKQHELQQFHLDSLQLLLTKLKKVYWLFQNINNSELDNQDLSAELKSETPKASISWQQRWTRITSEFNLQSASFRHAIRIVLFLMIAMLSFNFMDLQFAFWFMMAGVLVLQPNYSNTKTRVKMRVYGSIIGSILGVSLSFDVNNHPVLLSLIAVGSLSLFTFVRNMNYGFATTFLTMSVFASFRINGIPIDVDTIFVRIAANVLGALFTWGVMFYVFPEWNYLDLTKYVKGIYNSNKRLILTILGSLTNHPVTVYDLNKRLIAAQNAHMSLQSVVFNIVNDPQIYKNYVSPAVRLMSLNDYIVSNLALINSLVIENQELNQLHQIDTYTIEILEKLTLFYTKLYDYNDENFLQDIMVFVEQTNNSEVMIKSSILIFDINFYIKERLLGIALALINYRRAIAMIYQVSKIEHSILKRAKADISLVAERAKEQLGNLTNHDTAQTIQEPKSTTVNDETKTNCVTSTSTLDSSSCKTIDKNLNYQNINIESNVTYRVTSNLLNSSASIKDIDAQDINLVLTKYQPLKDSKYQEKPELQTNLIQYVSKRLANTFNYNLDNTDNIYHSLAQDNQRNLAVKINNINSTLNKVTNNINVNNDNEKNQLIANSKSLDKSDSIIATPQNLHQEDLIHLNPSLESEIQVLSTTSSKAVTPEEASLYDAEATLLMQAQEAVRNFDTQVHKEQVVSEPEQFRTTDNFEQQDSISNTARSQEDPQKESATWVNLGTNTYSLNLDKELAQDLTEVQASESNNLNTNAINTEINLLNNKELISQQDSADLKVNEHLDVPEIATHELGHDINSLLQVFKQENQNKATNQDLSLQNTPEESIREIEQTKSYSNKTSPETLVPIIDPNSDKEVKVFSISTDTDHINTIKQQDINKVNNDNNIDIHFKDSSATGTNNISSDNVLSESLNDKKFINSLISSEIEDDEEYFDEDQLLEKFFTDQEVQLDKHIEREVIWHDLAVEINRLNQQEMALRKAERAKKNNSLG